MGMFFKKPCNTRLIRQNAIRFRSVLEAILQVR
jgi:hypothetical protein